MKIFITAKKTTNKEDLELMYNMVDYYGYNLWLLEPILKLHNLYIMLTNYDVRTNNSQIYRIEHRKRTMIKLNLQEIQMDYLCKDWKNRHSKKYLPKKFNILDHSLWILFHEIHHYIRKDHLHYDGTDVDAEIDCDREALKYIKILRKLRRLDGNSR